MSYFAQSSDLVARYGADNLARMADPDGTGDASVQAAHIALALSRADTWVYGKLRKSLYSSKLPNIVDSNGNVPEDLNHIAVMWAGWVLSTAHGVRDYDKDGKPLSNQYADKLEAEQLITEIQKGETYVLDV